MKLTITTNVSVGRLVRWLLENNLVDEMNLLIVPVIVGHGHAPVPRLRPGHSA